ncbi:uncharacterized protein AB675_11060 [Cyphellophora attinorum]|uniref:Uncharacterized protein n=1 Tax=Cyphellophora attinorum TaxID=1664694 RepID=A0A0N1H299_9EURO|nr:uncharacterized protein AB675_11060 [Phialophora attinorum]KPI34347.1 hypothetical protein AB675_11060 [Phialophora attinorum]
MAGLNAVECHSKQQPNRALRYFLNDNIDAGLEVLDDLRLIPDLPDNLQERAALARTVGTGSQAMNEFSESEGDYYEEHYQAYQHYLDDRIDAGLDIFDSQGLKPDLPQQLQASADMLIILGITKNFLAERRFLLHEAGPLMKGIVAGMGYPHESTVPLEYLQWFKELVVVLKYLQTCVRADVEKDEGKPLTYRMLMIQAKSLLAMLWVMELKNKARTRLMRLMKTQGSISVAIAKMLPVRCTHTTRTGSNAVVNASEDSGLKTIDEVDGDGSEAFDENDEDSLETIYEVDEDEDQGELGEGDAAGGEVDKDHDAEADSGVDDYEVDHEDHDERTGDERIKIMTRILSVKVAAVLRGRRFHDICQGPLYRRFIGKASGSIEVFIYRPRRYKIWRPS